MKQIISVLFCSMLTFLMSPLTGQNLSFLPADCSPGDRVSIQYNPNGTDLEDQENFDVVVYQITDDGIIATELQMNKEENPYSGTFSTSKDAKSLFVSLSTDDGKHKDNNDGKGYALKMKTADKSTKIPGAYTSMAKAYGQYYRTLGIEQDLEKSLEYMKKEFEKHPALKNDEKYLNTYAMYASRAKNEAAIAEIKGIIEVLQKNKKQSEAEMNLVYQLVSQTSDEESASTLKASIIEKYPEGEMAKNDLINSFYKARDLQEKLDVYNAVKNKYGEEEKLKTTFGYYAGAIAMDYAKQEDWTNFEKYFSLIDDPSRKASYLNSLSWPMSGESVEAEAPNAEQGAKFSLQSLELMRQVMDDPGSKPASMTQKQWKKQLDFSYGMYADTYALLQYHNGNYEDAFSFQKIAVKSNDYKDGEMNERFCLFAEKAKGPEKAEKKLQWLIKEGHATSKMKEQYKRVFMANNTLETAYDKHMAALESVAEEKKREELKEKMINEVAPEFQLVNLKGEQVSLSAMKGKVVVLDFWATWCGPCKASFPGMQKAVNKYADNTEVEFLFLDTWERGDNKEEAAAKFMEENKYTFNVVMDNDNKAVEDFKVGGIPTKFVVDKNGKIRFKSVGFTGSDDGLVSELSLMIEMADEVSTPKTTSTP